MRFRTALAAAAITAALVTGTAGAATADPAPPLPANWTELCQTPGETLPGVGAACQDYHGGLVKPPGI